MPDIAGSFVGATEGGGDGSLQAQRAVPPAFPSKANRAGDTQPMPTGDAGGFTFEGSFYTDIQDLVRSDIARRRAVGIERYGQALQPHNGRDTLLDAYEEALDLTMYLAQARVERASA